MLSSPSALPTRSVSMSDSSPLRVVITGIGLRTPLGADRKSSWAALLAGQSGVKWLAPPQWTGDERLAGAPCEHSQHSPFSTGEPVVELALGVAAEAALDAGLGTNGCSSERAGSPERTGVVFGSSKGGLHTYARLAEAARSDSRNERDGSASESSSPWLNVWPDAAARAVAAALDCRGPVLCPVLACATGLAACQRAAELIREGLCDVVYAGSADASLQPAILGSFRRMGVLARPRGDDAADACRPFDRDRRGFVIGEGAACLVFESLEHALARQATWYGEWIVGRMLTDPTGLTQLDPTGASLRRLLRDIAHDMPLRPDYINLHGTATIPNDRVESLAVRELLGPDPKRASCSSLKGGLGHLLGAAGSVELAATMLALRDQIVPPTVNLLDPDPDFGLDFTPVASRPRQLDVAWKLSLGFGGHLAAACVRRMRGDGDRTHDL